MEQLHGMGRGGLTCGCMSGKWNFCLADELGQSISSFLSPGNTMTRFVSCFVNGMQS
jgi:hypothetical protein